MDDRYLLHLLSRVAGRYRRARLAWLLTGVWLGLSVIVGVLAYLGMLPFIQNWFYNKRAIQWIVLAVCVGLGLVWILTRLAFRDYRWIAARIEDRYPSLKQRLITLSQPGQPGESLYLRRSLIKETIHHGRVNDWTKAVSSSRMFVAWLFQFAALAFASTVAIAAFTKPDAMGLANVSPLVPTGNDQSVQVEPGNVEIERGTDLVITARFADSIPEVAFAESTDLLGVSASINLQRSLNDPLFGGYLRNVRQDFSYLIRYGLSQSDSYQVKVFDFPSLVRSDAVIDSPAYAIQPTRVMNDTRTVTVVEGATLRWTCRLNKPVVTAELIDRDGEVTSLIPSTSDPLQYEATFVMTQPKRWKLRLLDDRQRAPKFDEELTAKVTLNKPPETKLTRAQDLNVSPLQELEIRATAEDDFGIHAAGFTYALSDMAPVEIVFEQTGDASRSIAKQRSLSQLVDLESLEAKPDQLLSYYFWVEDIDRDGNVRRVDGDMFFAEVRPFEEIFREGDSPASEPGQEPAARENAKKAEELAELQKQIIAGTWNVLRKSDTSAISEEIEVLVESQQDALNQTDPLEQEIQDQKSLEYLNQVRESMTLAGQQLKYSQLNSDKNLLREGVQSERKAYEGLLKLRAREHEIVQSKQQKPSASSRSFSQKNRQEQIEQLRLDEEENRYEMEKTAEEANPAAERETRQVMNRLEELARRQSDINEQLKDLETAIQEAKNQNDKEKSDELEDRLKRLRENQEELLRDSDELLDRMNQPESQQALENAREQMELARNDLQQSVEALEQGKTEPAISSGTRAERQMEETRDELRKSSSDQLAKTMRNLLKNAEQLEGEQQKLQEKLKSPELEKDTTAQANESLDSSATPLRPEGTGDDAIEASESVANAWREQQKRLDALLEQMQETVTEAESSEPLLAEELYESFRETKQKGVSQDMQQIPNLLERGMEEPAKAVGEKVAKAVGELRDSIEEATEKVVGSEQASLRLALSELESAKSAIEAEANGKDSQSQDSPPSSTSKEQNANGQPSNQPISQPSGNQPNGNPTDQPGSGRRNGSGGGLDQMNRNGIESAPLTGGDYAQWTDTLRDIEELVSDPEMKADAARIREAAREMRIDYTRHSKDPQWPLVKRLIVQPLDQLREKVQDALLRASAERNAIVPVDRDPLPSNYQRQLDQYYENLGSGQKK